MTKLTGLITKLKKGDIVVVLSGKDKGKTGEIVNFSTKKARVIVKGINLVKDNIIPKNNPKCLLAISKNAKISRNEKCPATGKKYKHCCGAL